MSLFMRVNHPQPNGYNLCVTHHPGGCVIVTLLQNEALVIESILPPMTTDKEIEEMKTLLLSFMEDTDNERTS